MTTSSMPTSPSADAEAPPETDQPTSPNAELEDRLLRALADLDNLRKRYAREVTRERNDERARVAAEWLPVIDHLELALEHAGADSALAEGVRAVRDQAIGILSRLGFPRFTDVEESFDPTRHEAVSTVASETPPGTIVGAARPGYGTEDALLRPASVVVSRGRE
jgi:molecular chaperone GrpE